jgi:iron(III) transport system ATP-binding protein
MPIPNQRTTTWLHCSGHQPGSRHRDRRYRETTIGRFEAANLPDGSPVQVLIRPEGLSLTVAGQGSSGANAVTVLSARLVGRATFVRVGCEGGKAKGGFELRARIPGVFLPELGSTVLVQINPSQAFVFPAC